MIIQTLHAFAVGIGFSLGVLTGAFLCQFAAAASRKNMNEQWQKNQDVIEKRLADSLLCHERMAKALENPPSYISGFKEGQQMEAEAISGDIQKYIKPGHLPGDGRDETAERNGLILALNIIRARSKS